MSGRNFSNKLGDTQVERVNVYFYFFPPLFLLGKVKEEKREVKERGRDLYFVFLYFPGGYFAQHLRLSPRGHLQLCVKNVPLNEFSLASGPMAFVTRSLRFPEMAVTLTGDKIFSLPAKEVSIYTYAVFFSPRIPSPTEPTVCQAVRSRYLRPFLSGKCSWART